jgi:hypothetical protein
MDGCPRSLLLPARFGAVCPGSLASQGASVHVHHQLLARLQFVHALAQRRCLALCAFERGLTVGKLDLQRSGMGAQVADVGL